MPYLSNLKNHKLSVIFLTVSTVPRSGQCSTMDVTVVDLSIRWLGNPCYSSTNHHSDGNRCVVE